MKKFKILVVLLLLVTLCTTTEAQGIIKNGSRVNSKQIRGKQSFNNNYKVYTARNVSQQDFKAILLLVRKLPSDSYSLKYTDQNGKTVVYKRSGSNDIPNLKFRITITITFEWGRGIAQNSPTVREITKITKKYDKPLNSHSRHKFRKLN